MNLLGAHGPYAWTRFSGVRLSVPVPTSESRRQLFGRTMLSSEPGDYVCGSLERAPPVVSTVTSD